MHLLRQIAPRTYRLSLDPSQVAHQAGAYPGLKRLGVDLLPPRWDASPSQGYPRR